MNQEAFDKFILKDKQLREQFDKIGKKAAYGTAGFRDLATNMPYIMFRVGALVAIINKTSPSKSLGVVVSASHNKRQDNGVKITNFQGNMLEMHYEPKVEEFVNEKDFTLACNNLKNYLVSQALTVFETPVTVYIGGDTRPSTEPFLDLVSEGVQSQGGKALNFHLTTTPQLQYYVFLHNTVLKPKNVSIKIQSPQDLRSKFWQNFSSYFIHCADYLGWKETLNRTVDCANGVGGAILPHYSKLIEKYISTEIINSGSEQQFLNLECGADYVKTNKLFPRKFEKRDHGSYCSFDGDADRIVFYTESNGKLNLIDGDREGTIITEFFKKISQDLREKTQILNKVGNLHLNVPVDPSIGFIQTYYANYSSSRYLKEKYEMEPVYAATGVKNLHKKAEHYDIGVYFEANGHGTVIFEDKYLQQLEALTENKQFIISSQTIQGNQKLKEEVQTYFKFVEFYVNAIKISNPSVGDAISVFLLFQIALKYLKINYQDTLAIYHDLESLTSKIGVKHKENIKVTEIEDKVVEPKGLQDDIEKIIEKHKGKKAFLRASGTEDVLRLHVEAETKEQVQAITKEVTELVIQNKELN